MNECASSFCGGGGFYRSICVSQSERRGIRRVQEVESSCAEIEDVLRVNRAAMKLTLGRRVRPSRPKVIWNTT